MAIRHKGSLSTTVTVSRAPDLSGNFVCDGTADDVEINEALGYVNTLGGGRVIMKQGTYTLVDPIVFPGNNIWLRGMGRSTLIDGDALTTGNHAIELVARINCTIKKLAIQTLAGGGKTCYCIFADDDCADLSIHDVTIVNSDSDGVHIAGTNTSDIHIRGLRVDDVDDNGILVKMDGGNFCLGLTINGCTIEGAGAVGIHLSECRYSNITNNIVSSCTQSGIVIDDGCAYCNISNCMSVINTQHGIIITTTATHCEIEGCVTCLNVMHGIYLNAVFDCLISNCLCQGNDSGDTGTYDGIYLDTTSERNNVIGNHCCENDRYGIGVDNAQVSTTSNYVYLNGLHGINISGDDNKVNDNYIYDNNQKYTKYGTATAYILNNLVDTTLSPFVAGDVGAMVFNVTDGTRSIITGFVSASQVTFGLDLFDTGNEVYILYRDYHGINIADSSVMTLVEGNYINSPGDSQVDCIHATDGCHRLSIIGNFCYNGLGDGIEFAGDNDNGLIKANYCRNNDGNGIEIATSDGSSNSITDNFCYSNGLDGIYAAGADTKISGNYCGYNSQITAGSNHGIYLTGDADRCQVNDNQCWDAGIRQEDGIHLADGAVECQINNNYCYNGMGSGIALAANNADCVIQGNYCYLNDDYGIEVLAGCVRTNVNNNEIIENGIHGIYITATDCKVQDNHCFNNSQDSGGASYGIGLAGTADRCTIVGNTCDDPGNSQGDGIHLESGADNCQINDNYCYNAYSGGASAGNGITLTDCDNCQLEGNYCQLNDGYGIEIGAGSTNTVKNNKLIANVTGQISDGGTDTALPEIFAIVPNPDAQLAQHMVVTLTDGEEEDVGFEFLVPADFVELVTAQVVIVAGGTGDLRRSVDTSWGKLCSSEAYNVDTDTIAEGVIAVTQNYITCFDITAALTNLAAQDIVGVDFIRHGDDGSDTVGADCYCLGFRMRYV